MNALCKLVPVAFLSIALVSQGNAQIIGFGSSKPGSVNYTAASVLSQLLTENTAYTARTIPHSGTASTIYSLNVGEVDFAVSNLVEAVWAHHGQNFFAPQGEQENLRLVGTLFQLIVGILVREDSDLYTIPDLKGMRLPAKYTAQPIFETLQQALLANGKLTYTDVKIVPVSNGIQAADQFAANRLDAFFYSLSAGKVRETEASVGGLRTLKIEATPEAMARLREFMPVAYATKVHPEENIPGVAETMNVMTYDYVILAGTKSDEDVVYELTKTVYEQESALKTAGPLASFSKETMLKKWDDIDYHPGAIRYYKELGIWPPR